jgi:hypothetical protein
MDKTIVGFGKYQGLYLIQMLEDKKYCLWLLNQKWFKGTSYLETRDYIAQRIKCPLCSGNEIDYPRCPECKRV